MKLTVEDILRLSLLAPILLYFFRKSKKDTTRWVLFLFCFFVFAHALVSALLTVISKKSYAEAFNILFIPVEFIVITYFFYKALNYEIHKKLMLLLSIIFLTGLLVKMVLFPENEFDSILNGVESVLVILYSLLFFYEQLRYPKLLFIYSQPVFWGVSGFFLFFSTSFFVFIFRETLWSERLFIYQYFYIHALAGILRNVLFTMGMLIKPEKTPMPEFTS